MYSPLSALEFNWLDVGHVARILRRRLIGVRDQRLSAPAGSPSFGPLFSSSLSGTNGRALSMSDWGDGNAPRFGEGLLPGFGGGGTFSPDGGLLVIWIDSSSWPFKRK